MWTPPIPLSGWGPKVAGCGHQPPRPRKPGSSVPHWPLALVKEPFRVGTWGRPSPGCGRPAALAGARLRRCSQRSSVSWEGLSHETTVEAGDHTASLWDVRRGLPHGIFKATFCPCLVFQRDVTNGKLTTVVWSNRQKQRARPSARPPRPHAACGEEEPSRARGREGGCAAPRAVHGRAAGTGRSGPGLPALRVLSHLAPGGGWGWGMLSDTEPNRAGQSRAWRRGGGPRALGTAVGLPGGSRSRARQAGGACADLVSRGGCPRTTDRAGHQAAGTQTPPRQGQSPCLDCFAVRGPPPAPHLCVFSSHSSQRLLLASLPNSILGWTVSASGAFTFQVQPKGLAFIATLENHKWHLICSDLEHPGGLQSASEPCSRSLETPSSGSVSAAGVNVRFPPASHRAPAGTSPAPSLAFPPSPSLAPVSGRKGVTRC